MQISGLESFLIILLVAICTFATRVVPFILFPEGKEIPKTIKYLGDCLPPAIIGLLIIYCLKTTEVIGYPHGIPEAIASLVVVGLHVWKKNTLMSIGVGTVLYMFLIQGVF